MKDEILFAGKMNGRAVMVYRSSDTLSTLRVNVSEDPLNMLRHAYPVEPVNALKISRAQEARRLGIDARIPEPDYSNVRVDYEEEEFIAALLAMNAVVEDTPWGYYKLSWDWSAAFPHPPFDDGENGMRRQVVVRRKNGEIVSVKSWVGGYDTAIPDTDTWDYIPEEFVEEFLAQTSRFKQRVQERAAERLAELQREFGD